MMYDCLVYLIITTIINNMVCNPKDQDRDRGYYFLVKFPRLLLGCLLLFPSKKYKYKVELFAFISQLSMWIYMIVVLILFKLQKANTIYFRITIGGRYLFIPLVMTFFFGFCSIINHILWKNKKKKN